MTDLATGQGELMMRGIASAVRHQGALTATQASILTAVGTHLLGVDTPPLQLEPLGPTEFADALPDEELRRRAVHAMVTLEIVADPVPADVHAQVDRYARALRVDDGMLAVARDYSRGAMAQAMQDYLRNSYVLAYYSAHPGQAAAGAKPSAAGPPQGDPALAAKWNALETCPSGSHGRAVWDFYQMRGFAVPGTPGAVDPLLAQHDWVHCLADYGTSATGEIEVFTFISGAIPDPKGFSYAVVIIGLFETGYVPAVPGVATANPGHLSAPGGSTRFVDALRRGLAMNLDVMGGIDWFRHADQPIEDVRRELGVEPKSGDALDTGSLSALDPNAVFSRST